MMSAFQAGLSLALLPLLVLDAILPAAWGHRARSLELTSSLDVSGAHAEGLEEEHAGVFQAWPIMPGDESIIRQILAMLNPPNRDMTWEWQNSRNNWTFGAVMMTAQSPTGALALHMLHRHGLAPLLASRAGQSFEEFHATRVRASGFNPESESSLLQVFVSSQEEYADVVKLRGLLESLSLSGIRNFHSFDHDWSVRKYTGKIQGCTESTPAACVLQAGLSKRASTFLRQKGFAPSACKAAIQAGNKLQEDVLGSSLEQFTPGQAGNTHSFQGQVIKSGDAGLLAGRVAWEGWARSYVKIEMTADETRRVSGSLGRVNEDVALEIVDRWLQEKMYEVKDFMSVRRLELWTSEQAEFVEMYDRLPSRSTPTVSRDFPF